MEENDESSCIVFTCPSCGMSNVHDTMIEGNQDYDETEVPTGIAIQVIGEQLECANCNVVSVVGGTHPYNMTLILYEQMKEDNNDEI